MAAKYCCVLLSVLQFDRQCMKKDGAFNVLIIVLALHIVYSSLMIFHMSSILIKKQSFVNWPVSFLKHPPPVSLLSHIIRTEDGNLQKQVMNICSHFFKTQPL